MKSGALRLYVVSITVLVFFVLWAVVAAKPWAARPASAPAVDPRLVALQRRERSLRRESAAVNRLLARRWSAYRRRLRAREARIKYLERRHAKELAAAAAAAPAPAAYSASPGVVTLPPTVRVVTLPPAAAATSSGSSHP